MQQSLNPEIVSLPAYRQAGARNDILTKKFNHSQVKDDLSPPFPILLANLYLMIGHSFHLGLDHMNPLLKWLPSYHCP